jgi:hypothetical protein
MAIDIPDLSDRALGALIANHEAKDARDRPAYALALEERNRRKGKGLDLDTSLAAIGAAAKERRFLTSGDLAAANGKAWGEVRYAMNGHLGDLVAWAHLRGVPLLSAIVVSKPHVETGEMEASNRTGFVAAARALGLTVTDEEAFVREQQEAVFAWGAA